VNKGPDSVGTGVWMGFEIGTYTKERMRVQEFSRACLDIVEKEFFLFPRRLRMEVLIPVRIEERMGFVSRRGTQKHVVNQRIVLGRRRVRIRVEIPGCMEERMWAKTLGRADAQEVNQWVLPCIPSDALLREIESRLEQRERVKPIFRTFQEKMG
jgi:hypothetical protein